MNNEIWQKIQEYPYYEVSTTGKVRSIDRCLIDSWGRRYHKKGQLLKIVKQIGKKDNYPQMMVTVYDIQGKPHRVIVARLVAKTFIPNPNNYPQVNHKDNDSTNNNVENLEWCTAQYNNTYGDILQRRGKTRSRAVNVYDSNMNLIDTVSSGVEASIKYNVCRSSISKCCNTPNIIVNGYCFRFV